MLELRQQVPCQIAVQGNFHPDLLKSSQEQIKKSVAEVLFSMKGQNGFIVNLGHGVAPDTPLENVRCFVDTVRG